MRDATSIAPFCKQCQARFDEEDRCAPGRVTELEAEVKRLREALEFVSVEADREANSARAEVDGEHTTWQELSFRTLATFARAALESEREESVT
jgi:hypothetical protein